jgi:hypothetical protein
VVNGLALHRYEHRAPDQLATEAAPRIRRRTSQRAHAHEYPDFSVPAQFFVGLDALGSNDRKAAQWLSNVVAWDRDLAEHTFIRKYLDTAT